MQDCRSIAARPVSPHFNDILNIELNTTRQKNECYKKIIKNLDIFYPIDSIRFSPVPTNGLSAALRNETATLATELLELVKTKLDEDLYLRKSIYSIYFDQGFKWTKDTVGQYCQLVDINERLEQPLESNSSFDVKIPSHLKDDIREKYLECAFRLLKSFQARAPRRIYLTTQNIDMLLDETDGLHTWSGIKYIDISSKFSAEDSIKIREQLVRVPYPFLLHIHQFYDPLDLQRIIRDSEASKIRVEDCIDGMYKSISLGIEDRKKPLQSLTLDGALFKDPYDFDLLLSAIASHQEKFESLQSLRIYMIFASKAKDIPVYQGIAKMHRIFYLDKKDFSFGYDASLKLKRSD